LVCGVCSILVSSAAVGLKERQKANQILDRQKQVLLVTGLMKPEDRLSADEVRETFKQNITPRVITLETGEYADDVNVETFDQRRMAKDPATSTKAPPNEAQILRLPNQALVYLVQKDGAIDQIVLPVEGKGLWSTLYGYFSLDKDTCTVRGLTFYEQNETPGLGGEIENPRWKALWPGRKVYNKDWKPDIQVIKGQAGSPQEDPHRVDGLSGATLTSRGVQNLLLFWVSDDGFGPYLTKLRTSGGS